MGRKLPKTSGKSGSPKKSVHPPVSGSSQAAPTTQWHYDKGGPNGNRFKHMGSMPHAYFVKEDRGIVGKCPNNIPNDQLDQLLNTGIGVDGDDLTPEPRPSRIYIVHGGAVYRAKPTNPTANTWHAFPADKKELQNLTDGTWERIRSKAMQLGCLEAVEKWRLKAGEVV